MAYILTFTCNGWRLLGGEGTVDRRNNVPGRPTARPNQALLRSAKRAMKAEPFELGPKTRHGAGRVGRGLPPQGMGARGLSRQNESRTCCRRLRRPTGNRASRFQGLRQPRADSHPIPADWKKRRVL